MDDFLAGLLHGPSWDHPRHPGFRRALTATPLLLLTLMMLAAAVTGLMIIHRAAFPALFLHAVPLSGVAALAALLLAAPACLVSPSLPWLLPLWFAPIAVLSGWQLLPLPDDDRSLALGTTLALLPFAVCYLRGAWADIDPRVIEAASACGHPPTGAIAGLLLKPALAALPRAYLLLFVVGVALIESIKVP